jgi:hypothetical protein
MKKINLVDMIVVIGIITSIFLLLTLYNNIDEPKKNEVNFTVPKNIKISQNIHQNVFDKNILETVINIKDTIYNDIYNEIYSSTIYVPINNIKKLEKIQNMFSIILLSILSIMLGMTFAFVKFYFYKKKNKKQKELIEYHKNLINNVIKKSYLILLLFLISCIDIKYENKEPIKIQIIKKEIITAHSEFTYHYGYSVMKGKFCLHYGEENIPTKYVLQYLLNNDTIYENIDSLKYTQINIKDTILLNIKYKYVNNKLTDTITYLYE